MSRTSLSSRTRLRRSSLPERRRHSGAGSLAEGDYFPSDAVRRLFSFILQPVRTDADDPDKNYTCSLEAVPFELKAKRRDGKRGAPKNPVSDERNQAISDYYDRRMAEIGVGHYETVIAELVDLLKPDINESAIREAIKNQSPKSGS